MARRRPGPLATSWHSNKFLDPVTDGAVLPILHLNGYKISNPTILARITHEEFDQLLRGYGWTPYFVEGDDPELMHQAMASNARWRDRGDQDAFNATRAPRVIRAPTMADDRLKSPKGWTGPASSMAFRSKALFERIKCRC
jgi:xylulose-5-phosphate/fructose-6-phosphate phosphoketolase